MPDDKLKPVLDLMAESINDEEGFIWKIWTEDANTKHAGGIYLLDKRENAEKYIKMHTERLNKLGFSNFISKILEINLGLTKINRGPLESYKWDKDK